MRRKWLHFAYFSFIFATLMICLDMIVSRLSGGSWWWKSVKFRRKKLREFRSFLWTLLIDNFLLKLFINILNIFIFFLSLSLFFASHLFLNFCLCFQRTIFFLISNFYISFFALMKYQKFHFTTLINCSKYRKRLRWFDNKNSLPPPYKIHSTMKFVIVSKIKLRAVVYLKR